MKVYAVLEEDWEDRTLHAVCATRARAEAYVAKEFPSYVRQGDIWRPPQQQRGSISAIYIDEREVLE